jgi:dynein heavy chain, axonemal
VLSVSEYNVPVLFVLSTGVDPTSNILNYCTGKGITLETISLGQGQGKKAQHMIERCQIDGNWVLLNNCHLSKSWLGELERIISNFSEDTISNKSFRLLLSSMPVGYFPSNILQNADKITLEPPRGMKPNISRSFKELNEDVLNACPTRKKEWMQCLYSLTFFHALIQ